MPHTFERTFRVRAYECDTLGHVNNANYLRYMQEAAIEASADAGYDTRRYTEMGKSWLIRETSVEYFSPLFFGDTLILKTWVADVRRVRSRRMYEFRKAGAAELVARADTDWIFLDQKTGRPAGVPEPLKLAFFPEGVPATAPAREPFPEPPPLPPKIHVVQRQAEWRDIDMVGHVNNAVYLAYVEEAGVDVAASHGWPISRLIESGMGLVARKHRIQYLQAASLGEAIRVETWLAPPRTTSVIRHYLIRRSGDGALLAQTQTVWVMIDLKTGRPLRFPDEFMADIQDNIGIR